MSSADGHMHILVVIVDDLVAESDTLLEVTEMTMVISEDTILKLMTFAGCTR